MSDDTSQVTPIWRSCAVIPALVIFCISIVFIGVVVYIVRNAVANRGLMPPPAAMSAYACAGFATPVLMEFAHGRDIVKLQLASHSLQGSLLNGKIEWPSQPAVSDLAGAILPVGIEFDDPRTLKIRDNQGVVHVCTR